MTETRPVPQPPAEKKRHRWPWILGIVFTAILFTIVGYVAGSNETDDATADDRDVPIADADREAVLDEREAELDVREDELDELAAGLDDEADEDEADEDEPESGPLDEIAESDEAESDDYGAFDGAAGGFAWDDGVTVNVDSLRAFEASEYSAGGEDFDLAVAFTVTIINNSDEPYDPSEFYSTMQSGTSEGSSIYDEGMEGAPSTSVLPDREVSFELAYGVEDPTDLVLEVTPGWDYDAAVYIGGLGE
ncbi:hypothetical protein [Phytoactinopolyspora endophytica]|uniref:hypothetical protein n=1 Tax=Phytoactinopolyspora endophytica TaxID=1642495 RepID=UPI00101C0500|nr:hypothetical protein [Phytoactinopolyspora endophytica]